MLRFAGSQVRNKGQRCASRSYRATPNPGTAEPLNFRTGYEMASSLVSYISSTQKMTAFAGGPHAVRLQVRTLSSQPHADKSIDANVQLPPDASLESGSDTVTQCSPDATACSEGSFS